MKIKEKIKQIKQNTNKSIRAKLFLIMIITIMAIVIILTFINSLITESYYLYYKKYTLLQAYNQINTYLSKSKVEEIESELEKIAVNNNFNIVIAGKYKTNIYNSNNDFKYYMINVDKIDKKNILYNENNTYIILAKDYKSGINFLMLVGELENENTLYIRVPLASIRNSVELSNNFLYSMGLITIIISGVAILIITKKFTKPISELSNIANKMANLDFSQKYRIKDSDDEIDNLGRSINKMSDKLEETITKLQKNNSELEKDIEEKSKIDEMRKKFISDVSHELKTPISLIQGYSEGLIENVNTDDENRKFYAEVILDEANKMDKMVKELLELMRLEYGALKSNDHFINITEIIEEELRKYTVMISEKNIEVKFFVKQPIYVYVDEQLVQKILNNYISNSIKNAEEVKKEKYISINTKLIGNNIRISVFNTGRNISNENINKIWDRFYKEDESRNREDGGTGIGLSIVKAIMNNYKNSYGVINKENGVEFYFELNITKNLIL